jgi:chromosome segregation ATPase
MAAIQFELERLYNLTTETREELDEAKAEIELLKEELRIITQNNEDLRDKLSFAEHNNYALQNRVDCLIDINRTTYTYVKTLQNENETLEDKLKRMGSSEMMRYGKRADMNTLRMPPLE